MTQVWEPNGTGSGPGEEVSVIASCSAGNIEGSVNIVLNEREQPLLGGSYLSASINSDLNNRYTVVGCLAGTAVETDVGGCVCHCVSFLVRLFFLFRRRSQIRSQNGTFGFVLAFSREWLSW